MSRDRSLAVGAAVLVLIVAAAAVAVLRYGRRPVVQVDPETEDDRRLVQRVSEMPDAFLDFLVTSRLRGLAAAAEQEAIELRLANTRLSPDEVCELRELLARCQMLAGNEPGAAQSLQAAAACDTTGGVTQQLAAAVGELAAGRVEAAAAMAEGSPELARRLFVMSSGRCCASSLPLRGEPATLEGRFLLSKQRPQDPISGSPVELLPVFPDADFCTYDPYSFDLLAQVYQHQALQLTSDQDQLALLATAGADVEEPPLEAPDPGDFESTLAFLMLSTGSGRALPDGLGQSLRAAYGGEPRMVQSLINGYLALAEDDTDRAFAELRRFVETTEPPADPRVLITLVHLDYAALAYRVRRTNFAIRWVLGRERMLDAFPYLKVPFFYLSWLELNGVFDQ